MSKWADYLATSWQVLGGCEAQVAAIGMAVDTLVDAVQRDKPILICGNGGSAADSLHFAAELVGKFQSMRRPIRAMAICADPAILTAWSNDEGFDDVFARQVTAHGAKDGVLVAISTSGKSKNVRAAILAAHEREMRTIGLTGANGFSVLPHIEIRVPSKSTPLIQQAHLCMYHFLAKRIEESL